MATPAGGALAVIRISGPDAKTALEGLFSGRLSDHRAVFGRVTDGEQLVDEAVAVYYAAPRSYTGEDMAELSVHGGAAVVRRVLALLNKSLRPAEPGEFTRRAFINGKLDLSRAEAVMDIITAGSERAAAAAAEQLEGGVEREVTELEGLLTGALSGLDAAIDYPEELEEDVTGALPDTLQSAQARLDALASGGMRARVLREGAKVVLCGRPNAGKSSLYNALLGRDRAIVTNEPGTTRDILEEQTAIAGIPVRLIDAAGLRDTAGEAESVGVQLAKEAASGAALVLLAFDASAPLNDEDCEAERLTRTLPRIGVLCKGDLPAQVSPEDIAAHFSITPLTVSAATGAGLAGLKAEIAKRIDPGESVLITNARHIAALQSAASYISSAQRAPDMECTATDIRGALSALAAITGSAVDERVIDEIFARFCVGK